MMSHFSVAEFLTELVWICEDEAHPMLVGGDFNIIRCQKEKNNDYFNSHCPLIFNTIIESLSLQQLVSRADNSLGESLKEVTYEKMDYILAIV
jgi:hypothetical protein